MAHQAGGPRTAKATQRTPALKNQNTTEPKKQKQNKNKKVKKPYILDKLKNTAQELCRD